MHAVDHAFGEHAHVGCFAVLEIKGEDFPGADQIQDLVVGREADSVRRRGQVIGHRDVESATGVPAVSRRGQLAPNAADESGATNAYGRIVYPVGVLRTASDIRMAFAQTGAVRWIGEPDTAVGMRREIIGRIECLTAVGVGNHLQRSVELPAHHASGKILAGNLPSLKIEAIAVGVE